MEIGFPEVVAIIGALLVLIASLSGLAHGTILSVSVIAVAAGMGANAVDLISFDAESKLVIAVVELALIFTLFGDGLTVERELLKGQARNVLRALLVAMPLSMLLIAGAVKLLFDELGWVEALLVGAILAPTDPVITSSVVSAGGIPARLRHILNLESGLNDGLALPFVLVLIAVAVEAGSAGTEALTLLGEAAAGAGLGAALAYSSGRALSSYGKRAITARYEGVFGLGIALLSFGIAEATIGNGLVATFCAAIVFGLVEEDAPETFHEFNESVAAVLQAITFFVFGALVVSAGLPGEALAAVAFVAFVLLVGRPLPVLISFAGSTLPPVQRRFLAWFGPKGVASMLFALFVLKSEVPEGELIFQIVSVAILGSVLAHGLTDTIGARWIEARLEAGSRSRGAAR